MDLLDISGGHVLLGNKVGLLAISSEHVLLGNKDGPACYIK